MRKGGVFLDGRLDERMFIAGQMLWGLFLVSCFEVDPPPFDKQGKIPEKTVSCLGVFGCHDIGS